MTTNIKGVTLEVLGKCMTNTTPGSQHEATVEYRHLWSFAQQAALIAVSKKDQADGCYHLITDPEHRARRIAAHYADLYFKSAAKSRGKLHFHWCALAAFVVKDIVEAFRYSREEVLQREWKWSDKASVLRNSSMADLGSLLMTDDSPYDHVLRTYGALAKGNLWLFMDIYPWLWYFLEYGINEDGTLNKKRIEAGPAKRDWSTYQSASKQAVEELPFGPNWITRLSGRLKGDIVFKKAQTFFDVGPAPSYDGGRGAYATAAMMANRHCRTQVKSYDAGYRMPPSQYWAKFPEAFHVMEAEHKELTAIVKDNEAMKALLKVRQQKSMPEIVTAYKHLSDQFAMKSDTEKIKMQAAELNIIARHEQINVLQPLIYSDVRLKETMDMNHWSSRATSGWLSPQFKVVYAFDPSIKDKKYQTIFDPATGFTDGVIGRRKSLTNEEDRMGFVGEIADHFDFLMKFERSYMETELRKIRLWMKE
ncbi:hypothetical protein KY495_04245 [Massilia sp. PAMC28688]|uniref:DUF2515 family protein n=1 Tax=Massilia sp. PAMC28688 TaxID=2861283 RepID=UPI001C631F29|nr:hypothetical protein [Massilia sp. PAMC28688]QYF94435.1 hypothetical protein KY495_04245 [Massilia sp. PAMC28688]